MSASDQPKTEAERGSDEDKDRRPGVQPSGGVHEVPLFLKGRSDGRKGDAQDEKDEMGE
ncbi:MAG TPA: hypothetical protein VF591_15785 [Pyrinomonadaceae bacterium]|jgi:hypothetical protein